MLEESGLFVKVEKKTINKIFTNLIGKKIKVRGRVFFKEVITYFYQGKFLFICTGENPEALFYPLFYESKKSLARLLLPSIMSQHFEWERTTETMEGKNIL